MLMREADTFLAEIAEFERSHADLRTRVEELRAHEAMIRQ